MAKRRPAKSLQRPSIAYRIHCQPAYHEDVGRRQGRQSYTLSTPSIALSTPKKAKPKPPAMPSVAWLMLVSTSLLCASRLFALKIGTFEGASEKHL